MRVGNKALWVKVRVRNKVLWVKVGGEVRVRVLWLKVRSSVMWVKVRVKVLCVSVSITHLREHETKEMVV